MQMRMEFGVAKIVRKLKDESKYFGVSGAASFLQCAENTVLNHSDAGRLACIRDDVGRRIFTLADLKKFKQSKTIRPNCRQRVH